MALLLLGSVVPLAVITTGASGRPAVGGRVVSCSPPTYPGLGYFTSLQVVATTCSTGRRFVVAYYHCRVAAGGDTGRCARRVFGFKCLERRNVIPTEFGARVTCVLGTKRIVHTYQQNTS